MRGEAVERGVEGQGREGGAGRGGWRGEGAGGEGGARAPTGASSCSAHRQPHRLRVPADLAQRSDGDAKHLRVLWLGHVLGHLAQVHDDTLAVGLVDVLHEPARRKEAWLRGGGGGGRRGGE